MNESTDASDGDDDARPSLMIRVFGGVGVEGTDGPVSIGGRRQRRLLALLAIRSDTVVDIDWLAEYLWNDGDRPDVTAPPLRTYVSRLRSSFPEEARAWIVTEPDGYRLAVPADAVEHLRFARLRAAATRAREREDPQVAQRLLDEALELWRGDPFRELEDLDWVAADVERLRLDRLEMLEERWESSLALGRHTQITGELAAFTAEHGSRDRAARQYALALHRSGQTGEALRVITDHRKVLVEEFGLDPSREILELQQALLSDDPSLVVEKEGRPLRGYRLLEEIGSGAFSVVWRGVQPSVGRDVAIKQIRSGLASQPEFIRRFETEAHLVARIEHPYVVPLIDFWRDPDSAYLVMRWLRGGTLERRLDDGPLSVDETLAVARQIGGALAAAHAHGIVHRDVKTANILFDEQGNAFLTDFGIALEASQSSGPEAALSPGSPAYSSPEQIRQERLGPASDVFSLGVVLFEALTGSLPFTDAASLEEVIELQLSEPYPALSELRADVPESLSDAVARATAKDAGLRFDTMAAFLEALDSGALVAVGDDDASAPSAADSDTDAANPYQGLLAFDDADADRFFGRDRLVRELVDRFSGDGVSSRCVIVVGPSGSGKSSVVRAGLVPAIRAGDTPGSAEWFVTTMVPGSDPYEALEAALLRIAINPPPSLIEQLRSGSRGILRSIRRCLGSDGERVALVIDQFEEIFTASSGQDAHDFLEALSVAVEDPSTPLRLIVTLRGDYYDRPLEHPAFAQVLNASTVNVTPLAGDELERAIVEPARGVGVAFEPGLVARIAAETMGQPSPLPLLQYTLSELFERRSGRQLTIAGYDELGGLTGALASRAEAIHAEAGVAQRSAIRRVFGSLTNPGEESADLRRRVRLAELGDDAETAWVLDSYGTARLLTFDRDVGSREPTVEVAHEALLREWPRLATWLAEDAELLRLVAAIAGAATRWQIGGREASDLYRGGRLQRATELAASDPERLGLLDREFVEASQAHADATVEDERSRGRRVRALAAGVVVAFVLAVGFGGLAIMQQGRADDEARAAAEARGRAELATLITGSAESSDPDVGLLLALEAQRRAPGPETDRSLLSALRRRGSSRTVASFPALAEGPCSGWAGVVSRDGMFQTSNRNGIAVSRDLTTGEITEHGPMPGGGCGTWYGDAESGRRYATNEAEDKLWLGPFNGPWEREVEVPAGSFVRGPKAFGAVRLVLENPATAQAQLLDSRTGVAIGAPIEGLSKAPPRLSPDGSMLAVVRTSIPGSDAPSVAVHDAETGSLLIEADVAGQPQKLHFDIDAGHLLVATADRRLVTVDLTDGGILSDVRFDGRQLYNVGVREDGLVMAISAGDPGSIELLDTHAGLVRGERIDLDDLRGGVLRSDGYVLTWGSGFAVDVLDIDDDVLADVSVATGLVDLVPSAVGPDVILISGGRAVLGDADTARSVAVDLETGRQTTIDTVLPDGDTFDVDGPARPLEDGYLLFGKEPKVALWRDGRITDTLVLSTGETDTWEGVSTDGSRALAGISGDDGVVVHLLDFRDGRINDALRITVDEVAFGWLTANGGMGIILPDGTARRYDATGEVIDEFSTGLGDWEQVGPGASDGNGKIAIARARSANGFRFLEVVDLDARSVTKLPIVSPVSGIGFARGSDLLITKHGDGSVRGWDIDAGESIGILWTGNGVSFGPPRYEPSTDSVWVASVDRIVRLPLSRDVWRDRACERIGRDFTEEEWSTLVPGDEPYSPACS